MNDMKKMSPQRGQSLLEVVLAIALFTLGVVAIGSIVLSTQIAARRSLEGSQAIFLAAEGIAASRVIGYGDFDALTTGTHGLLLQSSNWSFVDGSDSTQQFVRVITVADISVEVKRVMSTVSWEFEPSRVEAVTLTEDIARVHE